MKKVRLLLAFILAGCLISCEDKTESIPNGNSNPTISETSDSSSNETLVVSSSESSVIDIQDGSLEGRVFMFSKVECDTWDAMKLAMANASNAGSTISFETETNGTIIALNSTVVQKYTYVREDNEIYMTITEMTVNGTSQDTSNIQPVTFTISGNTISSVQTTDGINYVKMIYVLYK